MVMTSDVSSEQRSKGEVDPAALGLLFTDARTHHFWLERAVTDEQIRSIYELMKWGPTSLNQQPARFLFLRSAAAKEALKPCVIPSNVEQVMTAPVTAIICFDENFYMDLPRLFPERPAAIETFKQNPDRAKSNAMRNGTLQGAYLMLAARAVGLDIGPMSGFDNAAVDRAFLSGTTWRSNFLCNIGYADHARVLPRLPRHEFVDVARII